MESARGGMKELVVLLIGQCMSLSVFSYSMYHWKAMIYSCASSCASTILFEPPHHKTNKNGLCAQGRLRSAWASAQSDQSLRCPHEESWGQ